jgi:polyisoprenoid-binding protein YceI
MNSVSITEVLQAVPTGTWKSDPIHSSIGFAVRHLGVIPFRGGFKEFDATLADGRLIGTARVDAIETDDENLTVHLLSPDFFDAARNPELRFESTEIRGDGDSLTILGELTLKGETRPVELGGTIAGPVTDLYGGSRIGLELETRIDRTEFGIDWNAELPSGGQTLANDVKLTAQLELVQQA